MIKVGLLFIAFTMLLPLVVGCSTTYTKQPQRECLPECRLNSVDKLDLEKQKR